MVWALMFVIGDETMVAVLELRLWASVMVFADFAVGVAVEGTLQVSAAVIAGSGVSAPGQSPLSGIVAGAVVAPSF